jgi:hypothetical protein
MARKFVKMCKENPKLDPDALRDGHAMRRRNGFPY